MRSDPMQYPRRTSVRCVRMQVVAAALLLLAGAALAWGLRPAIAEAQRELLRRHVAALDAAYQPSTRSPAIDPREQWRDDLPAVAMQPRALAQLAGLVETSVDALPRRARRIEAFDVTQEATQDPWLQRMNVVVRLQAPYAEVRALVARTLEALPNASLDAIELERVAPGEGEVRANLQWSLHWRGGDS